MDSVKPFMSPFKLEVSLAQTEYTLATFLDTEGAFNNVELRARYGAMNRLRKQYIEVDVEVSRREND